MRQLISPDTRIDFVGQARLMAIVSAVLVSATLVLMATRGFNWGIDFAGGTVLQLQVAEEAGVIDEGNVRGALSNLGFADVDVMRLGAAGERTFRVNLPESEASHKDLAVDVISGLTEQLGAEVTPELIESIGGRVGSEQTWRALWALVASWGLILIYIWFRFDLRYAPGAVVALIHDVVLTAGVYVVLGWEFNLRVLAALLVVIGYSLNDTIVIYDRIRENIALRGATLLEDVVNQSVNQTLSRTLLTSMTTAAVVVAILIFGGPVLRDFAAAMLIGIVVGTYSTIYIASSLLIFLEKRAGGLAANAAERAKRGAKA